MTVPWLYVGMVFSTFCWHNEDHFTYSANYQHFGETKTWYGIPGEDAEKFEQAMRDEVPELFETQPDLLFQLVTLARPEKLRKAGVRVFALDQHAGQFVITFPQAYHAGFNHGFNFNEAVNFAPHDWEPFGREGVKRLKEYRKQPCFSHDEMLLTAALRDHSIKTSKWLAPALERMQSDELSVRAHFLDTPKAESDLRTEDAYMGPRYKDTPSTIQPDVEEDEIICVFCKCYCYLSRYRCKKTNKTLCLLHAGGYECCDALEFERYSAKNGDHVLEYRMTDDVLHSTVQKVVDKANVPEVWMAKVDNELDENPRPSFKKLRTLLSEGDKIQYELPQLAELRRFVDRCSEWIEKATNHITRKQQNRRKSEKSWRKSTAKAADLEERERELRRVESIRKLLSDADEIGFDCDEIDTLRKRAEDIAEFQREANEACRAIRSKTTSFFEELVERGKEFHVDIPEIETLEHIIKRLRWDDLAKVKRPDPETRRQDQTLEDIEAFIADGQALGVADNNLDLIFFREHKAQAELWETKAKELMAVEPVHYQQLDSLSTQAANLPVSSATLAKVDQILRKQREVQEKIISLVEQAKNPEFRKRPTYQDMLNVVKVLDELQSKPNGTADLEKLQKSHEDWMRKGKKLFGKANAPLHILKQHMRTVELRNESCFDLSDKPRMPVEPSSRANSPLPGEAPVADGSSSSRDVFCICRKPEAGMMIECELCHEWYHGKCLKIARGKVKEDDKYTCPICDWRVKIPRDAARPKLEDLQNWYDELETLPFQPEEETTLANIVDHGAAFREFMKPFINPENQTTPEEVGVLRFHLRKIEGADILLAEETNYLRQELHKWAPVAPEAPPAIQISMSTRKPRPTKQQKLMAQLGIANPEDLPQQYKLKAYNHPKRKGSDLLTGTPRPPLQPAGSSASPASKTSPGLPGTSVITPTSTNGKFYTALSLQVLGELANAPVVSPMLQQEKHMNSEKLTKMKHLLQTDRSVWDDVEAMKRRLANYTPTSNGGPAFSYGATNYVPNHSVNATTSSQREPAMFSTATPTEPAVAQSSRLASPPTFGASQPYGSHTSPLAGPSFDTNMFDNGPSHSMFDSPGASDMHMKNAGHGDTSPDFESRSAGIFESPRRVGSQHSGHLNLQAGLNSPQFGGSQQSVGNMDNVFADFVTDHDAADSNMTATSEARAKEQAAAALAAAGLAGVSEKQNTSNADSDPTDSSASVLDPALTAPSSAIAGAERESEFVLD
nr:lid2 complex component lid2 [Quercus suber]